MGEWTGSYGAQHRGRLMFLQHLLLVLAVILHSGWGLPTKKGEESDEVESFELSQSTEDLINDIYKEDGDNGDDYDDGADTETKEFSTDDFDSMEEIESIMPVKSIKEVQSIKEVKHITPIEEAVALAAIKKFRLHNQLEDENDESEPSPYTSDEDETGLSEAEEIEAEIEKEQEVEAILDDNIAKEDEKIEALKAVKKRHLEREEELQSELEELGENLETELGEEVKSIKPIKNLEEVKSIEPIKSIQKVRHIYELTPTQARELKRLVEEAEDSDNDYIVP